MSIETGSPPLRRCIREPIPDIFEAARDLDEAVAAHEAGDRKRCNDLIKRANRTVILDWVAPMLGPSRQNPFLLKYDISNAPPVLPKMLRDSVRMPSRAECRQLIERDGLGCAFCGIPLVRVEVRKALMAAYPDAVGWGPTNNDCHAALLTMWLQYDHVLPHSRGGKSVIENVVLTCAGCNFARMSSTLEEVGLTDPRREPRPRTSWGGLERFLELPKAVPYR